MNKKDRPVNLYPFEVQNALRNDLIQTRRVIKPQIETWTNCYAYQIKKDSGIGQPLVMRFKDFKEMFEYCPYGKVGDRLWVRETWGMSGLNRVEYKAHPADGKDFRSVGLWKSPLFMPRKFSRIILEITNIRVEKLQKISEKDAIAEGIDRELLPYDAMDSEKHYIYDGTAIKLFKKLWDSIHRDNVFGWDKNPWTWVLSFKRIK